MYLSKFTDFSFRLLIYLAKNNNDLCKVEDIARDLNISEHHLKKVVQKLGKTEYIVSLKGRSGGLKLGKKTKDINLGEVLRFTEDNMNIAECFSDEDLCNIAKGCKLKSVMKDALDEFTNKFDEYTLEDVL